MKLHRLQDRFEANVKRLELVLNNYIATINTGNFSSNDIHLLEGWLSELWQVWCKFCRTTVVVSGVGCESKSGAVAKVFNSYGEVSYVAWKQKGGVPPATIGTNSNLRVEPTWGDLNKLNDIVKAVSPSNKLTLLSAFGTVGKIDEIRIIRNAAAHKNSQNISDVINISSGYLAFKIYHPVEALLWLDPNNGKNLIHSRIEDMIIASRNSCL